jgi:hypothetical protein
MRQRRREGEVTDVKVKFEGKESTGASARSSEYVDHPSGGRSDEERHDM